MKAKELIKKLQEVDQESEVIIQNDGDLYPVTQIINYDVCNRVFGLDFARPYDKNVFKAVLICD